MYSYIKKRDGRKVKFNDRKIMSAIERAGLETGEFAEAEADKLTKKKYWRAPKKELTEKVPGVEQVQDIVEEVLLSSRYKKTAKAYIILSRSAQETARNYRCGAP